jgi:predicted dehydrogenase
MQRTTRFGVLGTGRITRRLVAELQQSENVQVTAIASREASRSRWFADQFGIPHAFAGYRELITSDVVDAVYIALPPSLHTEWAIAAAEQQKHVLCEKPLAIDTDQATQFDAVCRRHAVQWLDATGWLHHDRTRRIREIIDSGTLGPIRHISASVSFFEPFQSNDHRLREDLGGGVLLDLGWYAFGLPVWVMQSTAQTVLADAIYRNQVPYRVSAVCRFGNDVSATISCGYDTATRKWMEIAGDNASIVCDDFTRPWPDRTARFWVHDRAGSVSSEKFECNQEGEMIRAFTRAIADSRNISGNEVSAAQSDLGRFRSTALATQETLKKTDAYLRNTTDNIR